MKIADDKTKQSCKLGEGENCCAFLMMAPNGWICSKDEPALASHIRARLVQGTMNTKGEGDWDSCLFTRE